ncbi:hypothetical protein HPP92_023061 [Vanilla planifolia]|uniref:Uncharacterized protein n=1 Tax=Vanilla planifolia TaxID=51239 RepID=A0A835PZH8_VANPL|nr:hypothetical protein HPP92_023061 [Vanilla planifolia]
MSNRDGHISHFQARCPLRCAEATVNTVSNGENLDHRLRRRGSGIVHLCIDGSCCTAPQLTPTTLFGGAAGWFFNETKNPSVTNYNTWAATQSFYLGDFPTVVEVPLSVEGLITSSDAGADGIQCAKGMRFHIAAGHGRASAAAQSATAASKRRFAGSSSARRKHRRCLRGIHRSSNL